MKQHRLAAAVALVSLVLAGCDSQTSVELKTPAQKASYGIGLNMGKSLAQEGMDDLDSKAVAQGIEDAVGKKEQKLKDEELVEAFSALQKRAEERMTKMSEESAAAGKKYLEENAKKDGVVTTASGLQYKIVKKAEGAQPKPTDVVTVHYTGKLTNGTTFDSSVVGRDLLFLLGRSRAIRFDELDRRHRAVGLVFGDLVAHHRALGHQLAITFVQADALSQLEIHGLGVGAHLFGALWQDAQVVNQLHAFDGVGHFQGLFINFPGQVLVAFCRDALQFLVHLQLHQGGCLGADG